MIFRAVVSGVVFLISRFLPRRSYADAQQVSGVRFVSRDSPNSRSRSGRVLVESSGFRIADSITSSANIESFTFPWPIWILLISFSCPIAVAETSRAVLGGRGERARPELRGGALGVSVAGMALAVGFSRADLTCRGTFPPSLLR